MHALYGAALPFSWKCPVCSSTNAVNENSYSRVRNSMDTKIRKGAPYVIIGTLITCQNRACGADHVTIGAYAGTMLYGATVWTPDWNSPVGIGAITLQPTVPAPLSDTVPQGVAADFNEAHLIRQLSPKAAATLARRALQGMIRHYWNLAKRTLAEEIEAIADKCDAELYAAMKGLKAIGNIGAHPEKNVDEIIPVDPGEVDELLSLILILDTEWYVAKEKRRQSLAGIARLAAEKRSVGSKIADASPALSPVADGG